MLPPNEFMFSKEGVNRFKKNWPNYNFTFSTSTRAAQILMNDIVIILDYKKLF